MRVVHEDEYLRVEEDAQERVLIVKRKPKRFPSPVDMEVAYLQIFRAPRQSSHRWNLLLDSREAPGSSDDETERRIRGLNEEAERRFALVVVLMQSVAGMMQGQRLRAPDPAVRSRSTKVGTKTVLTRDADYALELVRAPH